MVCALLAISVSAFGGEAQIKLHCQNIKGEIWCSLPKEQMLALINNNNHATVELEKLRKSCDAKNLRNVRRADKSEFRSFASTHF
jgi:hypothetical protein